MSQRQDFVTRALSLLVDVDTAPDPYLIGDVVDVVAVNGGIWPLGEPLQTIRSLVESVTKAKDERQVAWRHAVVVLQALLLEFSDRIEKGEGVFNKTSDSLMRTMLAAMKDDLNRLRQNRPTSLAYRIALMLASNYSAIPSRKNRASFIHLLRSLVKYSSGYKHPFLEDLVLIYKNMDLGKLERIWEEGTLT